MRTVAQFSVAVAPLFLGGAIPFLQVVRGRRASPQFVLCWALLVFWMTAFSLGAPLIAGQFSPEAGRSVSTWVPEGPAVFAVLFFGWAYAGVIIGVAALVRYVVRRKKEDTGDGD